MSSLILGLGGFLVIKGQLTIGQLVAAELVTTIILASFSKAGKYLESFYDLYAAIDKLSHFYNMPLELASETKTQLIDDYDLNFLSAQVKESRYDFYFNYNFEAGKKYFIHSKFYSSKLVFLELAQGLIKPQRGSIEIGNARFSQLSVFNIKDLIYIVDSPTILEASIIENLRIGNSELDNEKLRTVLELVDLAHLEDFFKEGLQTKLIPSGYPLWSSQIIRLEIARALLSPAKILIITEIFDQVEDKRREKILNYIISEKRTLILFSHKEIYNFKFDKFLMMERDMITAYPSLAKLRENISQ